MPIAVTLESDQACRVLANASARKVVAEVRFHGEGESERRLSARLLGERIGRLWIERPVGPDGPVEVVSGSGVDVCFNWDDTRYGFEGDVLSSGPYALDEDTSAEAIELGRFRRAFELRRRADFRVPLWSTAPVMAHFEPLLVRTNEELPPSEAFHAELQNISAGGVAALVDPSDRACLAIGQHYMMDFYMPGCDEPFCFAVRVQHIRRLSHNDARLIGLKFLPGDDLDVTRRAIREIRSFVEVHRRLKP